MGRCADEWERAVAEIAAEPDSARLLGPRAAILIWSIDGADVLWSSRPGSGLRARLTRPDGLTDIVRARLGALGRGLAPRGAFRLERLRLGPRQLDPPVTLACRIVSTAGGDALLTVALDGVTEAERAAGPVAEAAGPAQPALQPEPEPAPVLATEPELVGEEPEPPRRKGVRFTWEADREGRFTAVSPQLAAAVGERGGRILGCLWRDLAGSLVRDDGGVARAFEGAVPWSRREVGWLDPDRAVVLPVEISGAPLRRHAGHLDGYRGFGTAYPDEAAPAELGRLTGIPPRPATSRPDEPRTDTPPPASHADGPVPGGAIGAVAAALTGTAGETMLDVLRAWFVPPTDIPGAGAHTSGGPDHAAPAPFLPGPANTNAPDALTGSERGALTEIARALGGPVPDGAAPPRPLLPEAGILPEIEPRPARTAPDVAEVLDAIPAGLMVFRHRTPLYANGALLALVEQPDLPSLVSAGGLDDLMLHEPAADASETALVDLARASRPALPLEARLARIAWGELPATLALVAPLADPEERGRIEALERALAGEAERSARISAALDLATDGVVELDGAARIASANGAARRLLGRDDDGLVGDTLTSILVPEDHHAALGILASLRDRPAGSLQELEVRARQRGRAPRPLWMRIGAVGDGMLSVSFRDATESHALQADLREARREAERVSENRAEFLARVSHEIRTPLTAITGFAELILAERFGPLENERYRSYIRDIHQSSAHVLSLVNDLLDLAKVTSGHSELTPVSVDLNAIVQQCIALSMPIAARERTILRTSFPPGLPSVFADERSVRQIVLNVLTNAIRFTGAGGQVIVSTATGGRGEVLLSIRDTGPGMTEKDIEAALTPFRRISATQRRDGTGLGLPLSKALVEANGGVFDITSAPHVGTLVEVRLPMVPVEAMAAE